MKAILNYVHINTPSCGYPGFCYFVQIDGDAGHGMFASADQNEAREIEAAINRYNDTVREHEETLQENAKLKQRIKALRLKLKGAAE